MWCIIMHIYARIYCAAFSVPASPYDLIMTLVARPLFHGSSVQFTKLIVLVLYQTRYFLYKNLCLKNLNLYDEIYEKFACSYISQKF